jgi:hypothetical protein
MRHRLNFQPECLGFPGCLKRPGQTLSLVTFLKIASQPNVKSKGPDENGELYIIKILLQAVLEKFKKAESYGCVCTIKISA